MSQVDIGGWMIVATSTQGFEHIHEFEEYPAVQAPLSQADIGSQMIVAPPTQGLERIHEFQEYPAVHGT